MSGVGINRASQRKLPVTGSLALTQPVPVGLILGSLGPPVPLVGARLTGDRNGQVAQLVEQRTENPRVGGSIPPLATILFKHGQTLSH